jgi:hypothetical protein
MADQAIYQRQTGWQEGYEARYRSHNRAQVAVTVAVAVPLFVIPPIKDQVISTEAAHAFLSSAVERSLYSAFALLAG